jgi:2-methylcitrate dehydratase PrpD
VPRLATLVAGQRRDPADLSSLRALLVSGSPLTPDRHREALDVLGPVVYPQTVHQALFSIGTVLALAALHGQAGLGEFDRHHRDAAVAAFRERVHMQLDAEVDAAYPARWIGKVVVTTRDGRVLAGRVDEPKGDPGNTLSRTELEDKALRLAAYHGGASAAEMRRIIARIDALASAPAVPAFFASD